MQTAMTNKGGKPTCPWAYRIRGVGLIEVLVTMIILSTALLTLTALQTRSLQFNHSAYLRSQANIFAYDILDRVRINWRELAAYNLELDDDAPTANAPLAQRDLGEWRALIEATLPGGSGGIECDNDTRVCTVTVRWEEQNTSGLESEDTSTFTYTSQMRSPI
ncbi:type IV pilus modification protein PilV [Marinimicrobium sp. ABcell2]|uniref:type IV pilus modification protein PilV n=1 Tax=Marinimicrobium sp. ABcell2 TaxID=3069751 RepID=UPI00359CB577